MPCKALPLKLYCPVAHRTWARVSGLRTHGLILSAPVVFSLSSIACRLHDPAPRSLQALPAVAAPSASAPNPHGQVPQLVISGEGVGTIRLCASLDTVDAVFRHVRDTTFHAEGLRWPAKVVPYGHGEITFEASWVDPIRIWRITTNSGDVHTPKGFRVGMSLRDLLAAGEHPRVVLPEGEVVILFESEALAATIDSASEAEFYRQYDFATVPNIEAIPSHARITEIATSTDCAAEERR